MFAWVVRMKSTIHLRQSATKDRGGLAQSKALNALAMTSEFRKCLGDGMSSWRSILVAVVVNPVRSFQEAAGRGVRAGRVIIFHTRLG